MERFFSDLKTVQRFRSADRGRSFRNSPINLQIGAFGEARFDCSFALQTTLADGYAVGSVFKRHHYQTSMPIYADTDL